MRPSSWYLALTGLLLALSAATVLHAQLAAAGSRQSVERKAALVRRLSLTDLCLFTEASYTRHPAVTDLATAFQDSPLSFEHFPSGALFEPPRHLPGVKP